MGWALAPSRERRNFRSQSPGLGRGRAGHWAEPPAYLGPRGWPGEALSQPLAHRQSASYAPFWQPRAAGLLDKRAVPLVFDLWDLRAGLGSRPKLASQDPTMKKGASRKEAEK